MTKSATTQPVSFYGQSLREQVQEDTFDADQFISETRMQHRPFEQLRDELEKFGKGLDVELLDLINRDYAELVNLSANLSGLDRSVEVLKNPIHAMLQDVNAVRNAVKGEVDRLESLLENKKHLQKIKAIAQRFITIDHLLSKMEELLNKDGSKASIVGGSLWVSSETSRLQRLTNDFNSLLFHIEKAGPFSPFVEENSHRIRNVESSLTSLLKTHFSHALSGLDHDTASHCLVIFSSIEKQQEAENLFRDQFALPALLERINAAARDRGGPRGSCAGIESMLESVWEWISGSSSSASSSSSSLSSLISNESGFADAKTPCRLLINLTNDQEKPIKGFKFIEASLFEALNETFKRDQMGFVFQAGLANEWKHRYDLFMKFVSRVESLCGSTEAVLQLRSSPVFIAFVEKWNLAVYYNLRLQEIAPAFEESLRIKHSDPLSSSSNSNSSSSSGSNDQESTFFLKPTLTLWKQLQKCWDTDVCMAELVDNFLKLSLQLISRYCHWVDQGFTHFQSSSDLSSSSPSKPPAPPSSSSSSSLADPKTQILWSEWLHSTPLHFVFGDLLRLRHTLQTDYTFLIQKQTAPLFEDPEEIVSVLQSQFKEVGQLENSLQQVRDGIMKKIIGTAIAALQSVRGIMQTYRMTNRPAPSRPSFYVSSIMASLQDLLSSPQLSSLLDPIMRHALIDQVATAVCHTFQEMAVDLLSTVLQQSKAMKMLRKASAKGQQTTTEGLLTDDDKIAMQLNMDIEEYGRILSEQFNLDVAVFEPFASLKESITKLSLEKDL